MIMATGVVGFRTVESVANVLAALQNSTHNGFPIGVTDGDSKPTHMRGASYSNLVSLAQLQMAAVAGGFEALSSCHTARQGCHKFTASDELLPVAHLTLNSAPVVCAPTAVRSCR
jgi:hypothetical protein